MVSNRLSHRLDEISNLVEANTKLPEEVRHRLAYRIDQVADVLDGKAKVADLLQHDSDEPYMKTFDRSGLVDGQPHDADEPYMKNFNEDKHSQVQHRKEPPVRMSTVSLLREAARECLKSNPRLAAALRRKARALEV